MFRDVYLLMFTVCPPLLLSSHSSYCVWAVVSIYPARAIVELGRIHSNLIACHMKSFVFCHCGSTGDQYCQERVGHVCIWEREISLNTCEEREALKDAAALVTSFSLVRIRWGLIRTHAILFVHTVTQCLAAQTSAGLKSGWTGSGKPH